MIYDVFITRQQKQTLIKGGIFMEWNLVKRNDGGYLLKTVSFYDTVIQSSNFIATHDRNREELIIYDKKDLIMVKRYDSIKTTEEYRFDGLATFVLLNKHILLALDDKNFTTLNLVDQFGDPVSPCDILYISPSKYLVITEIKPENVEFYRFEFHIFDLNEEKSTAHYFTRCSYSYHLMGNYRLLECDNLYLYDLLAEKKLEFPEGKDLAFYGSKTLDILYASKDFFVVTFTNLCRLELDSNGFACEVSSTVNPCLYVNGKLVHIFKGEEYKEILPRLQELSEATSQFKTLVIKEQLWVWTADEAPEAIPIASFLKAK